MRRLPYSYSSVRSDACLINACLARLRLGIVPGEPWEEDALWANALRHVVSRQSVAWSCYCPVGARFTKLPIHRRRLRLQHRFPRHQWRRQRRARLASTDSVGSRRDSIFIRNPVRASFRSAHQPRSTCATRLRFGAAGCSRGDSTCATGPAYDDNQAMVNSTPPPQPRAEAGSPQPSATTVWVPGHWTWRSGWVWTSGTWKVPPAGYSRWISGRWEQTGTSWRGIPGYWT